MGYLNLLSLLQARSLPPETFAKYLQNYNIKIRDSELMDLEVMLTELQPLCSIRSLDFFYVSYNIPQIAKEFDLLRFGLDCIINIEIKRNADAEKIKVQLLKSKFYLQFLGYEMKLITFIAEQKKFYILDNDDELLDITTEDVADLLCNHQASFVSNIDPLFDPANYLVSPFNSTEDFIFGNYFLTGQQDLISKEILRKIKTDPSGIFAINGKAGTGKTLLSYDIAKKFKDEKYNVLIIHCGTLNSGHITLRENLQWNIIAIKNILSLNLAVFDIIIVDESQRIFPEQLELITDHVVANKKALILSYDDRQYLKSVERKNNVMAQFIKKYEIKPFILQSKVRTNREIAGFIRCLFDRSKKIDPQLYENIIINYFSTVENANDYIENLRQDGYWKIINFTPSRFTAYPYDKYHQDYTYETSHSVIGQEFDNVLVVIDKYFYYNEDRLSTKGYSRKPIYHPAGMLYQNMTRTRKKLNCVIIDNPLVLDRCLEIKNRSKTNVSNTY